MITKTTQTQLNRIRETLDRLYDQQPPHFREQLRKLQEDPTSRVFAPLAESYRRLGRIEEAIEICQRGLEHHPDFHGGRVALAKCYLDKHRFQDAQRELERVVHLAPENLLAQRLLGDSLSAQGLEKHALHAYKMASLLAPFDINLAEKIRQIESGISDDVEVSSQTPEESKAPQLLEEEVQEEPLSHFSQIPAPSIPTPSVSEPLPEGDLSWEEEETDQTSQVNAVLGYEEESEDVFAVGSLAQVFKTELEEGSPEITTETLGDLYFTQGQYGHSLKIFEKIYRERPSSELANKMRACKVRLGVDPESQSRNKKIEVLRGVLQKIKQQKGFSE